MRKYLFIFLSFILLGLLFLNPLMADDYEGEEPIIDGEYTIIAFLQDGNFTVPEGVTNLELLIVAGGGSGGSSGGIGGAGGAGGVIYDTEHSVSPTEVIEVFVGLGGQCADGGAAGNNGEDSVFDGQTAVGGGQGAYGTGVNPSTGGSGGAGGGYYNDTGAAGTTGQGYAGGNGSANPYYGAGGGGGCGGVGGNANNNNGGNGGLGCDYSDEFGTTYGESGWFASGGAGGGSGTTGTTSNGGGSIHGQDAQANTGGGGGTAEGGVGDGGSGIIIIKYLTPSGLPIPSITYPTNASVINDATFDITWDYNSTYEYHIQVTLLEDNFSDYEYNESEISEGSLEVTLTDGDYRARLRTMKDGSFSDWSTIIDFTVEYIPLGCRIPVYSYPANYGERIPFVIKADDYINSTVYDYPVYLELPEEFWDLKGNDDENDMAIYGHYSVNGLYSRDLIELPYEVIEFNSTSEDGIIYFKAPILKADNGSFTQNYAFFYIYTDYDGTVNNENSSFVWDHAWSIWHLEDNTDSSGYNRNLTEVGTPIYSEALIGKGLVADNEGAIYDYLKYGSNDFSFVTTQGQGHHTVLVWINAEDNSDDPTHYIVTGTTTPGEARPGFTITRSNGSSYHEASGYWFTSDGSYDPGQHTTSSGDPMLVSGILTTNMTYWYFDTNKYIDTDFNTLDSTVEKGTLSIGRALFSAYNGYAMDENSYVDELWLFDELKTEDWVNLVYYNVNDYEDFIDFTYTIDPAAVNHNTPRFRNPSYGEELNTLKSYLLWEEMDNAISYQIRYGEESDLSAETNISVSEYYKYEYMDNDDWYVDVRSVLGEGNYSCWLSYYYDTAFSKNDKPEFTAPITYLEGNVTVINTAFEWSQIHDVTHYNLEVYNNSELTNLIYTDDIVAEETTVELENGLYYARVRGEDSIYNGEWSDTLIFRVSIVDIPFDWETDFTNFYADDTLTYYFTGLDTGVDYTFNINRLNQNGSFNSTVTTQVVTGDEANEGDFGYSFGSTANYPFEVEFVDTGVVLKKHYVMPEPTIFHDEGNISDNRIYYDDTYITAVAVGNVVYNNIIGEKLHDPSKPTQSLYDNTEYIIVHYQIPRITEANSTLFIRNMYTNEEFEIHSSDLNEYNGGGELAEKSFIIIPLNGELPDFIDSDFIGNISFVGDNWSEFTFDNGAYEYGIEVNSSIAAGESIFLIGENSTVEWSITTNDTTYEVGETLTATLTFNTEEIWNTYKNVILYDYSSQTTILGDKDGSDIDTEVYPWPYIESSTKSFTVSDEYTSTGRLLFMVFEQEGNYLNAADYYPYYTYVDYTIAEETDYSVSVDSFLESVGISGTVPKLILAFILLVGAMIGLAMFGMPTFVLTLSAIVLFILFVIAGLIPLWVTIILGVILFVRLYSIFFGGGGDD